MLAYARNWLEFFVGNNMIPMKISKSRAGRLLQTIQNILYRKDETGKFVPREWTVYGEKVKASNAVVTGIEKRLSPLSDT